MITVEIIVVTQERRDVLEHLDPDVFDHAVRAEFVEEFLSNSSNVLIVAVIAGVGVGMASGIVYVHPDKPRQLFINEVGVAPSHQRKGIGRRLIQAMLALGRERGCNEAWVATEHDNLPARGLYEATGGSLDPTPISMYIYDLKR